jgi:hypothetical protein
VPTGRQRKPKPQLAAPQASLRYHGAGVRRVSRVEIAENRDPYLLTVRMPGPRSHRATWLLPYATLYMLAMLLVDALAARIAYDAIHGGDIIGGVFTALVLAVFFGTMNVVAVGAVAWSAYHLWGTETATFDGYTLRTRRALGGLGRWRHMSRTAIGSLRLSPVSGGAFEAHTLDTRGVVFDLAGKTRFVGGGLTPGEAAEVLAALQTALTEHP